MWIPHIILASGCWFSVVKKISMPCLLGPKEYLHCEARLPFSYSFLYPDLLAYRVHIGLSVEELIITGGNSYWYFWLIREEINIS